MHIRARRSEAVITLENLIPLKWVTNGFGSIRTALKVWVTYCILLYNAAIRPLIVLSARAVTFLKIVSNMILSVNSELLSTELVYWLTCNLNVCITENA